MQQNKSKSIYPTIANLFSFAKKSKACFSLYSICLIRLNGTKEKVDTVKLSLGFNGTDTPVEAKFLFKAGIPTFKRWRLNFYKVSIGKEDIFTLDMQNKMVVKYKGIYQGRIAYSAFNSNTGKGKCSILFLQNGMTAFFRQSKYNSLYFTVREKSTYDTLKNRMRVSLAYWISKLPHNDDLILMYEKESSRYEESASVLYEKLIDLGYKNVFYIINGSNRKIEDIAEKYKKNLLIKDSFKHLICFFRCKKFVGTETLGHAMELRSANKRVIRKINSKDIAYIFLQHGVMYMVSLSSEMRSDFRQGDIDLYRVVVSSELEADHFIELGGLKKEELYITGLAKFDRSIRNDDADKIVIMPTWRRWESNLAKIDFKQTKYYKMMERMFEAIPAEYSDKIIVLPHPLMKDAMEKSDCMLKRYTTDMSSYDDILKTCRLLITDYSSIAYDAFYRGSNVIFFWEEKEECMGWYGEGTKLMLDIDNVFGDVCYDKDELSAVITSNYLGEQKEEFINNYKKIVEFNDGKNSERIIRNMVQDGVLKD